MKGLWKENLGSWNHKDSKRKKQTRNHTLKDNIKVLTKREINYYKEGEVELFLPKSIYKDCGVVEVWNIMFSNYEYLFDYGKSIRAYYIPQFGWFDDYTNEIIEYPFIKRMDKVDEKFIQYPKPVLIKRGYKKNITTFGDRVFLYGKPLPVDFWHMFGYWSTRRRKWCQTYANRKDRVIIRDWINKSDWNKEIPTHEVSKSIAWMVW